MVILIASLRLPAAAGPAGAPGSRLSYHAGLWLKHEISCALEGLKCLLHPLDAFGPLDDWLLVAGLNLQDSRDAALAVEAILIAHHFRRFASIGVLFGPTKSEIATFGPQFGGPLSCHTLRDHKNRHRAFFETQQPSGSTAQAAGEKGIPCH